jgi:hypothetical protein
MSGVSVSHGSAGEPPPQPITAPRKGRDPGRVFASSMPVWILSKDPIAATFIGGRFGMPLKLVLSAGALLV